MAIVLAALAAVILLAAALTRTIVNENRAAQQRTRQAQAMWLAESGASRAAAQLNAANDYAGETWRISAAEMDGEYGAVVVIRVEPPETDHSARTVRIEARYPDDPARGVLHVKQLTISAAAAGEET